MARRRQTLKVNKSKKGGIDMPLFITLLIMLAFGLIMIFSASSPSAYYEVGDKFYYIKRQLLFTAGGFGFMFWAMNVSIKTIKKYAPHLCLISLILMIAVIFVGQSGGGAQRWLAFGPITFQPSELAKYALVFYFAKLLTERPKNHLDNFVKGFLPYIGIMGAFAGCLFLQDHLSGMVIIFASLMVLLFAAGAKPLHFSAVGVVGVAGLFLLAYFEPYRLKRLTAFIDPFADKMDTGWQIVQGLYAIGSGGMFGRGLGQSRQKFLYIPEAHNDYIYAIICEELGFVGALFVAVLFAVFITRGIYIALNCPDKFCSLTAFGITAVLGLQYLINVGVVTSTIPNTGMQLPFFSAGGTSLIIMMAAVGVLLNISRYAKKNNIDEESSEE